MERALRISFRTNMSALLLQREFDTISCSQKNKHGNAQGKCYWNFNTTLILFQAFLQIILNKILSKGDIFCI